MSVDFLHGSCEQIFGGSPGDIGAAGGNIQKTKKRTDASEGTPMKRKIGDGFDDSS